MKISVIIILLLFMLPGCGRGDSADPEGAGDGDSVPSEDLACRARGFNYTCWWHDCYEDSDDVPASLDAMEGMGANWIELVPTWYQADERASEIALDDDKSPTEASLRTAVSEARERGFQIAFKPHVDLVNEVWRGDIDPDDPETWQDSYRDFILTFADLAQEVEAEILVIGTELKKVSGEEDFWRGLIAEIRDRYDGLLTYAANWDEYDAVPFWEDLDFIGIDFYFPLTDDSGAAQEEMEEVLEEIRADLQAFTETHGKDFLFTEIGYRSIDGSAVRPYDFSRDAAPDEEEQERAYRAVLNVFDEEEDWLRGIFWWRIGTDLGSDGDDYLPFGKRAGEALEEIWGDATCESD